MDSYPARTDDSAEGTIENVPLHAVVDSFPMVAIRWTVCRRFGANRAGSQRSLEANCTQIRRREERSTWTVKAPRSREVCTPPGQPTVPPLSLGTFFLSGMVKRRVQLKFARPGWLRPGESGRSRLDRGEWDSFTRFVESQVADLSALRAAVGLGVCVVCECRVSERSVEPWTDCPVGGGCCVVGAVLARLGCAVVLASGVVSHHRTPLVTSNALARPTTTSPLHQARKPIWP